MSYKRCVEDRARIRKLYNDVGHHYTPCVYYDERKGRIIKTYLSSGRKGRARWLKRQSNKKIRKYKGYIRKGAYKKVFDYWWELI